MKIYLASSWRNELQPEMVARLRGHHEVYDFRNPRSGGPVTDLTPHEGFSWKAVNPTWREAPDSRVSYREMLSHPIARAGFHADFSAMKWADACVLLLPCGRSAHLEAGWMVGRNKPLVVFIPKDSEIEPELMYLIAGDAPAIIALNMSELLGALQLHALRIEQERSR